MSEPRVLVVHNSYRDHGGEERAVELQTAALARAGVASEVFLRDSGRASRAEAATAMLRGGASPGEVGEAVRRLGATVAHVHNMQPLIGPRGMAAAQEAGARVVLNLHNFRLFCAIGVAFRDGETCFRCRGRLTLPGVVLNCRGSLPEAAVYGAALAAHQSDVLGHADALVTPSRFAARQLARLGVPAERLEVVPSYLPEEAFAERSSARDGAYALVAGRLAPEKGVATAIDAAARSGVPLKVAGSGPLEEELRGQAERLGAAVEFLGRVDGGTMAGLVRGAAVVLVPSVGVDVFPFSALEAMATGAPVVASRTGGLPEMVGEERCVPRRDPDALAGPLEALWKDPDRREREGDALIARARERFGEARYVDDLMRLYGRLAAQPR